MPRPSNTEHRRREIARALMHVMARKGYDGASVVGVAEAARLAPGLVHYHFKTKLEILLALLDRLAERHEERLEAALSASPPDAWKQIERFIEVHLALGPEADADALACWIAISAEALRHPEVRRRFQSVLRRLTARLKRIVDGGVRSGELRCRDSASASAAIVASIQGCFVVHATAPALIPPGSAAKTVREMALGVLNPRGGGRR